MKIVFVRHQFSSQIPTLNGGGLELLLTMLLEKYEQDTSIQQKIA